MNAMWFVFNVAAAIINNTGVIRFGAFCVYVTIMIVIDVVIGIMDCGNPNILAICAILNRLLDIYIILTKCFVLMLFLVYSFSNGRTQAAESWVFYPIVGTIQIFVDLIMGQIMHSF